MARLQLEVKWPNVKAQQAKEALSMNAMAKALKVLQGLVLNKRETNAQLSLELREAHKEKGAKPSRKAAKAMKTQMLNFFTKKNTRVKQWAFQVEIYFESQMINTDVD
jgi:predicted RNA-binding protein with RPS1 domain